MATLDNDDLTALKSLMEVTIGEAIEEKLVTKDDVGHLPTKDEFYVKWMKSWENSKPRGKK